MRGDKRVHDGMNDRHPVGSACSTAIVRATSLGQTVASDARLDSSSIAAAFAAFQPLSAVPSSTRDQG